MFGKCCKKNNSPSSRTASRWRLGTRTASNYKDRVVSIGNKPLPFPPLDENGYIIVDQQTNFVGNQIKSSKYTVLTFIPRNLFEQFRRIANFYFLIVGIIQLTIESPVSPFTSIAPLVFVVLVTGIKQGYEDYMRHKADGVINRKLVTRVEPNGINMIQSQKVQVGDVLCVEDGEEFPCDMLLLSGSNPNGKVTIMTANLDGETNLKTQSAPSLTRGFNQPHLVNNIRAQVECENPCADLSRFVGRLKFKDNDNNMKVASLGLDNVAFRGTQLKNTEFIYGCAIYTGPDTKMSQNSRMKSNKFSSIEVMMNKYLIIYVGILLVEIVLASILKYTVGNDRPNLSSDEDVPWYLGKKIDLTALGVAQDSLSFLVLFNYIVPISLYVTLELQKFFGSLFLTWDLQLYDPDTNQAAKCNSSDLNEELGQVEYLFSDKTGTLTENVMIFKRCSIDGVLFKDDHDNLVCESPESLKERSVRKFLEVLALCHTVQATKKSGKETSVNPHDLNYSASSPDEKAIVEACRNYGVAFLGEKEKDSIVYYKLLLSQLSRTQKTAFERLHVLEFDSVRKRMSVLIRDFKGVVRLVTKGAEVTVLPRCSKNTSTTVMDETVKHINQFATEGLRTLAVAVKTLDPEEYDAFVRSYAKASQSLEKREAKIRAVYDELEDNLELIGAIGVEDKLQEGVRDTLIALGQAGIKVWILTGDKKETAINISWSCGHLRSDMKVIDVTGLDNANTVERVLQENLDNVTTNLLPRSMGLVVDGTTLSSVFSAANRDANVPLLRNLAENCASVICCRMSPLQKAEIVAMMKSSHKSRSKNPVTAAIGDGANDVAMIQEAHVGLGIMGKEGRAAVRSADFAFAKFKHLKRVLLVHGHWYYVRAATLVQYFFYKNVAGFTAQLLFAFINNYSTQSLYDSFNITLFNITFTSAPIFAYGMLEQNIKQEVLINHPQCYQTNARNRLLQFDKGLLWFLEGFFHSIVTFFGFYFLWLGHGNQSSKPDSLEFYCFGLAIYQSAVVVVNLRLLNQAKFWNWLLLLTVGLSLLFFLCFTLVIQTMTAKPWFSNLFLDVTIDDSAGKIPVNFEMFKVVFHILADGSIWLTTIIVILVCLLPYEVLQVKKILLPPFRELWDSFLGKKVYNVSLPQSHDNTVHYYVNSAFEQ